MLSYVNIHAFITYSFLIMLPLILLFKKPEKEISLLSTE